MSKHIGYDKKGNLIKVYKAIGVKGDKWRTVKEDTNNPDINTELRFHKHNTKNEAVRDGLEILLENYISDYNEIEQLLDNPYINIEFDFNKYYGENLKGD